MKTQKIMWATAISLLSSGFLLSSLHPALAVDCRAMIQKHLDAAVGKDSVVRATITMHAYEGVGTELVMTWPGDYITAAGRVEYANGSLYKKQNSLAGVIPVRWNTQTWEPLPPGGSGCVPGSLCIISPEKQPFAPLRHLTYGIEVTNTGVISVATLLNGKYFLGRKPVVFQGTCSGTSLSSVITGVVNEKAYTVTLKRGYIPQIH